MGVLKWKILIERSETPYRHRWECNIKKVFLRNRMTVEWIDLAVDAGRWRAHVNLVMTIHFP